jgi:5-formyltetrahydrofolate cyclo-ligase
VRPTPSSSRDAPAGDGLRRALRARRAALPAAARAAAARRILASLAASPLLRPGREVALYMATGGEVPTDAVLRLALARGCRISLPRISDYGAHRMQFIRWRGGALRNNHYGIAEPRGGTVVPAQRLQRVLLPLTGFDGNGSRIGSGAGYYDRAFAFRLGRRGPPLLVGLGFEAQRTPLLQRAAHDVPLDMIVTERGLHAF